MSEPRPVDSEGEIFFNNQQDDQYGLQNGNEVASSARNQESQESDGSTQSVLTELAGVLKDVVKEIQTTKQMMENQLTASEAGPRATGQEGSRNRSLPREQQCHGSGWMDRNINSGDAGYGYQSHPLTRSEPYREFNRGRIRSNPTDIKIPSFTGKDDWQVWHARFEAIACRFGWTDEDRLDQLLPKLEGLAGEFVFVQLPTDVLYNYKELVREMNSRFRRIETEKSFAAKFSRRDQRNNETAEEYASELKMLYDKAHGYRDRKTRNEDLVRRFLNGLKDDEIRFEVEYHKEPDSIDEAVFHVVNFIQTRCSSGHDRSSRRNTVRSTHSDGEEEEEKSIVRSTKMRSATRNMKEEKPEVNQESNTSSIQQQVSKILERLESLEKGRMKKTDHGKKHIECFSCHKMGHYARECPEKRPFEKYSRRSDGQQHTSGKDLNFNGPSRQAEGRSN